jgi:uncharacterized membrane protein
MIARRARGLALAVIIVAIGLARIPVTASVLTARACNRTPWHLYISIAYFSGDADFFVSRGWWKLNPGQCAALFPDNSYNGHRYYYAKNDRFMEWYGGDRGPLVCIDQTNPFEIHHADALDSCPLPYQRQSFTFASDGVQDFASPF